MANVKQNDEWLVQRRRLGEDGPHTWETTASAIGREQAERRFNLRTMYICCNEMRLLTPDGQVAMYYRDPSSRYNPEPPRLKATS